MSGLRSLMEKILGDLALQLLRPIDAPEQELPIFSTVEPSPLPEHTSPLLTELNLTDNNRCLVDVTTKDPRWLDFFISHFLQHPLALVHPSELHHATDDLLFFVRFPHESNQHDPPVFVKRKTGQTTPQLDDLIAWKETFFLNLISQMSFEMTVSVCHKRRIGDGKVDLELVHKVSRHVYASPYRTRMDLKEAEVELSYPIIYFCVNDYEQAFDGMAVQPDQYLCVELTTAAEVST